MLDPHCELLLEEFKEKIPVLREIENFVKHKFEEFVKENNILVNCIESRVKSEKSLEGKLLLKGHKYQTLSDITDLVGVRVVTFYSDEIDKFAVVAEKWFEIDRENSIDKRNTHDVDQFGYSSLHYICRIPKELYYDEKYPEINEIRFEFQIRTALQHLWATIYHDTGYKNDIEVPRQYLRRLNRLAGILELADEEFKNIKNSLNDYRRSIKYIIKDGRLDEVELNKDTLHEYLSTNVFDDLLNRIASINNMEIEKVESSTRFLRVCKLFELNTLYDLDEFRKKYSEDAYQICVRQFQGMDVDIISSLIPFLSLCNAYILRKGYGVMGLQSLLEEFYGHRAQNVRLAKKIYSIGVSMGIVPKDDNNE